FAPFAICPIEDLAKLCNRFPYMDINKELKQYIDEIANNQLDIMEGYIHSQNMDIWIKKLQ
ncbi:hypothetical protein V7295_06165, partial [Bacillus toyonensis]|uniref:hypothetical protein n=1 Tax=Bacillus toyonensis TaxID=155322 RepID=UPI000BEDA784